MSDRSPVRLPADHPARAVLAGEVHARPPAPVVAPAIVSGIALLGVGAETSYDHLCTLGAAAGVEVQAHSSGHAIVELPGLRVSWERHGEFVRFTFIAPVESERLEELEHFPTALDRVPAAWLAALPGQTISATDALLLPEGEPPTDRVAIARWLAGDALAGAVVLDGAARLFTDFVLRAEGDAAGRTRWILFDTGMGIPQSARLVQRVLEIETYRMLALLGLPLARAAFPALDEVERRLASLTSETAALRGEIDLSASQREERRLLDELTRIAAEVEHSVAETAFRFSAGAAYWSLVQARVGELRERRVGDMRTIGGFLARRMEPAMHSAAAAARRQDELSARIERASTLLRTRVDVALEEQNQKLLVAMDRRSQISLRIQQAVEGLSIAAISYYGASLVEFIVKPLRHVWPRLDTDWIVAGSIPVIAFASWRVLEHVRKSVGD